MLKGIPKIFYLGDLFSEQFYGYYFYDTYSGGDYSQRKWY